MNNQTERNNMNSESIARLREEMPPAESNLLPSHSKRGNLFITFSLVVFLVLMIWTDDLPAKAFPGAEGYASDITGGRGGQVIHVTNLDASGSGSLQAALSASGPRIIVFDVSGVIEADEILIENGDFTLAGETAPGGGITIAGKLNSAYLDDTVTNFIIRHLRIRPRNLSGTEGDAIRIANNSNFILDHISVSWGSDETVDVYQSHDFTIQWSTIEESATHAGHPDGNYHNYGLINGPAGSGYTNIEEYLHYRSDLLIFGIPVELAGDVNGDSQINLQDAIMTLRIMSDSGESDSINKDSDVNSDGKIGLEETIYILQHVASLR